MILGALQHLGVAEVDAWSDSNFVTGLDHAVECRPELRVLKLARDPERHRQVERADHGGIHALDGNHLLDIVDAGLGFHLNDDHRFAVRRLHLCRGTFEIKVCHDAAQAVTAPAQGRELHRANNLANLVNRLGAGIDNSHCADIQHAR